MGAAGSPIPFIKDEPEDHTFNMNNPHKFSPNQQQTYNMGQQQPLDQFNTPQSANGSINPSELSMQNGNFVQSYPTFGSQQNLNYGMSHSGIADDELLDLGNLDDTSGPQGGYQGTQYGFGGAPQSIHEDTAQDMFQPTSRHGSLAMGQGNQIYSSTPDGAPIQSPFIQGNFNYDNLRQQPAQPQHFGTPLETPSSFNPSPHTHPGSHSGSYENSYMSGNKARPRVQGLERQGSHPRSPLTPKTPAMGVGGMNLGTPESGSFPSQPIHTHNLAQHRHQKSLSNHWEGAHGSLHSYVDSPISSPSQPSHHAQISDILKSGKHASLPAKVENGGNGGPVPAFQSQEAKRRRRRESHNMVERRRRDNINERIQELSHLVPHHRLEDEKVRKHLVNNSPMSPTVGPAGMSPPQATSLLAGGSGKRACGNITTGIPIEEKDKGPNKGDILNGSVSWTRDLMWALYAKLQQESEIAEYIASIGGTFPFEQTEDDKRMRTELLDAMEKNDANTFSYSRGPGSGLRVPKHTNLAGEPSSLNGMSPQSLSPTNQSGGSANVSVGQGQGQFWSGHNSGGSAHGSISFKEEDEYNMDLGD
ncbi:MAG: hypothetical protein M1837_004123 [Sclerophora amabilis]|nr:MAG: hypothetical protein M1837_004123 [Sclerophora amabilis]